MDIDIAVIDALVDILYERISQKFNKQLNTSNVEYSYTGIVRSYDSANNTATVELANCTIENIPNRSGEALSEGDTVKVFSDRTNMDDAYIGVRLSQYVSPTSE